MLTEKDYCDYETCVALKELGYNGTAGECSHFGAFHMNGKEIFYDRLYNSELKENECLRVPLYLAQKWLREEKDIFIYPIVDKFLDEEGNTMWNCQIYIPYVLIKFTHPKNTFEDALLDGIKEAIKFIKENEET